LFLTSSHRRPTNPIITSSFPSLKINPIQSKMLSFISSSAALALILSALQVQGHAIITPALGGGASRDDVQRPSASAPCGAHVDIVGKVGFSQVVQIKNGQIPVTVTNFNTWVYSIYAAYSFSNGHGTDMALLVVLMEVDK
jgi:hypothetical protein